MSLWKLIPVLFQLLILSIKSCNTISCPEIEKHSLLSLKQSLHDPYSQFTSWDGEVDCCKWKNVVCNNLTGHVVKLLLQGESYLEGLSGKLNPSLLNLKYLTHLDLSQNNFTGETIPSFIGSFTNLEHLDLSDAGFVGKIPYRIGNLSNLRYLYLQNNNLEADNLEWLWGFQNLEHLNMNYANLSRATNWAKVINSLPSLLELNFSGCSLDFTSPVNDVNLTNSLRLIDLSRNNQYDDQSIPVPRWFFQLNSLLYLDLSGNPFVGSIPTVINATKLQYIDLGSNRFNSSIPDWLYFYKDLEFLSLCYNMLWGEVSYSIGNLTSLQRLYLNDNMLYGKLPREITNLCRLKSLDLSWNQFHGEVQYSFGNMSHCFLGSLEELDLSRNQLSGRLVDQFGEFKSIQTLYLPYNSLSGTIPDNIGNLSSLEVLTLHSNHFIGNIPKGMGRLSNLEILEIQNNKLEGIVSESHFTNLSKLRIFTASRNHLTLDVGHDWIPPISLVELRLVSWSLSKGSDIPSWLQLQRNITTLDISDTGISGTIPLWFLNIYFLNVSHNNLHGKIPRIGSLGKMERSWGCLFYMSHNNFSGSLPKIGDNIERLDLSQNFFSEGMFDLFCDTQQESYGLRVLILEGNRLSGELPDCWEKWPSLIILKLGHNGINGSIPKSLWFMQSLLSLSVYNNKLSGCIPFIMQNNTELLKIDLSHNNLDGSIPTWMGASLVNLKIFLLSSNRLSGEIPPQICNLQNLQIFDLSNNQFSGIIPRCISNLTAMATKRVLSSDYVYMLSGGLGSVVIESASVVTKGVELEYSKTLSLVTNMDLSMNNLSGDIPKELTSLVELRSLNLSGNHFTGPIPESIGDMKQLESLDFSQNSLSGHIPNGFRLLSYLNHLNLSFNKLTGRIPESTQLQSLDGSSFIGNDLCGPPLSNCSSGDDGHEIEEKEGDEISEKEWLYILLSLGYAVGFSAACTALVLKKSWRDAYFGLLECMWDKIYVYLYVKWGRLTR